MGAIGWIGFSLNTMIIILPSLLICVRGFGDSIHFISEYHDDLDRGMPRRKAMVKALFLGGAALPAHHGNHHGSIFILSHRQHQAFS